MQCVLTFIYTFGCVSSLEEALGGLCVFVLVIEADKTILVVLRPQPLNVSVCLTRKLNLSWFFQMTLSRLISPTVSGNVIDPFPPANLSPLFVFFDFSSSISFVCVFCYLFASHSVF